MTEPNAPNASTPQVASPQQLLIDLGPVALFVVAYNVLDRIASLKDEAVYLATGIFIAATLVAIVYTQLTRGRIPPVLIVTGVIIAAFGGLTIALHNPTFIQMRPSIANLFYAVAIVVSVAIRQNVWKLLFGHIFTLPDRVWTVLALRWAALFFVLAIINEIMRHTLTMSSWVTWHFPILYGATMLFAVANAPLVIKHMPSEEPKDKAKPAS